MKLICVVLTLLMASAVGRQCCAQISMYSSFIGRHYDTDIAEGVLETLPKWNPDQGNPPLSAKMAKEAADREFAKLFDPQKHPGWQAQLAFLELCELDDSVWMWVVNYDATWNGYAFEDDPQRLGIPVLFTGDAVVPEPADTEPVLTEEELQAVAKEAQEDLADGAAPRRGVSKSVWKFGGSFFGQRVLATLNAKMLANTPDWKPGEPNPPLTLDKAFAAAQPVQLRWMPTNEKLRTHLDEIYLEPLHDDKWAWVFHYEQSYKQGGGSGVWPEFLIAVLMDGKAVEPVKVEPKK